MEASHADNSALPTEADRAREVILYAKNEADISFDYETQDVGVADPWPQRVIYGCQCKIHYVCVLQCYAERHIKLIQYVSVNRSRSASWNSTVKHEHKDVSQQLRTLTKQTKHEGTNSKGSRYYVVKN